MYRRSTLVHVDPLNFERDIEAEIVQVYFVVEIIFALNCVRRDDWVALSEENHKPAGCNDQNDHIQDERKSQTNTGTDFLLAIDVKRGQRASK